MKNKNAEVVQIKSRFDAREWNSEFLKTQLNTDDGRFILQSFLK